MAESKQEKKDCTNPLNEGVTYAEFLEAIGKKSVAEALKGKCTDEEIQFVEKELKLIKNQ